METLVIKKDKDAIKTELERCPQVCKILDSVLTKLQEKGYNPNLDELEQTLHGYCSKISSWDFEQQAEKMISNYLKELVIESNHPNEKLLGLKLKKEKISELLEIPSEDVSDMLALLSDLELEDWHYFRYTDFDSNANRVVLNPDYKKLIDESHTVYAYGKKQIEITKILLKICDGLTEYENLCGISIHREEPIPGIRWKNKRGELDVNFIRKY